MTDAELSPVDENADVLLQPEGADPQASVEKKVPKDILERYEVYSYKNAAVILAETREREFVEICDALRAFTIAKAMIAALGGDESAMLKCEWRNACGLLSTAYPHEWDDIIGVLRRFRLPKSQIWRQVGTNRICRRHLSGLAHRVGRRPLVRSVKFRSILAGKLNGEA
jgi:hypothetical protein